MHDSPSLSISAENDVLKLKPATRATRIVLNVDIHVTTITTRSAAIRDPRDRAVTAQDAEL